MIKKTTPFTILILFILLGAFALRLHMLNAESVWHDEGWSIRAMRAPFITPDDKTPFFYYFTGHLLQLAGVGESPLALRYASVLYGVVTVALGAWLARHWFGIWVGLLFGILLATSPLLWEYSQEVRAYSAVPLWTLALLLCADAIARLDTTRRIPYRLLGLMMLLQLGVLYTHNLGVPLVVWVNMALGVIWLMRWDIRKMVLWAISQIMVIVAYLPWMLSQAPSGTALNNPPTPSFDLMRDVWRGYFLPALPQLTEATNTLLLDMLGIVVLVVTGIIIIMQLNRHGRGVPRPYGQGDAIIMRLWLIGSQVFLLPLFGVALFIVASIDFHPRYFIASAPATLLWLLIGVAMVFNIVHRQGGKIGMVGIAVIGVLLSIGSIQQITTTRTYQHDDFAGLAEYYGRLPEDAVILIPFDTERALEEYYAVHTPIRARFVNIPIYSDEATAIAIINQLVEEGVTHLEFLTWFQLPADVRGMYPCLLASASSHIGAPQTFYGLQTQPYTLSQPILFHPIEATPHYAHFSLLDAGYATSSQGTCFRSQWQIFTPFDEDLALSAMLVTSFGKRLADDDASIARDDSAGTSRWRMNDTGSAYALLQLPQGALLTDYDLYFGVYSPAYPSGFDLLDEAGNPMGVETRLSGAIHTRGANFDVSPDAPSLVSEIDTVQTGVPFVVTLIIPPNSETTHITLMGDNYLLDAFAPPTDRPALTWVQFIIPHNQDNTSAVLAVDGTQIATYPVEDVPRLFEQPSAQTPLDTHFIGVGMLVGADTPQTVISGEPFSIRLVWRGDDQLAPVAYTVFVQLLDDAGRVIAQSDAQPSDWQRPTTSWIAGEYIEDAHIVRFNVPDFIGEGRIIVGFYDANDNFWRVMTTDGRDHAELPITIRVEAVP